jgi:carbon starvation protein
LFSTNSESSEIKGLISRFLRTKTAASIFTLVPAYLLAITGYQSIWALFGAANQLLAALTLIACTMFFKKTGRGIFMLIIPTVIMLTVTYTSLIISIRDRAIMLLRGIGDTPVLSLQMGIGILLLILGVLVAVSCTKKLLEKELPAIDEARDSG